MVAKGLSLRASSRGELKGGPNLPFIGRLPSQLQATSQSGKAYLGIGGVTILCHEGGCVDRSLLLARKELST